MLFHRVSGLLSGVVIALVMTAVSFSDNPLPNHKGITLPTVTASFIPSAEASVPPGDTPSETPSWGADITRLPNGLTVLTLKDTRFPLASVRLYVHAGSAYETPKQAGISHLLEHMVFKGTEKRPKGGAAGDIEAIGGYINAATSFDYTVYLADVPSAHWKTGMDVLSDMAFHAAVDPDELESEKKVVLSELERGEDNPSQLLFKRITADSLAGTPYARPIIGFRDTVSGFTRDDITEYIATHYQPQSMLLVVAGDVDPQEVLREAERLFGDLRNTHPVTPPMAVDVNRLGAGPTVTVEQGKWNKVYLSAALPIPGFPDSRSTALEVLAQLLGGDRTSSLYRTFKYDSQLVDDISVGAYTFERVGLLYLTAVLDAEKLPTFWKELTQTLSGLSATMFSDEELERARLNLEDAMFRTKETLPGLTSKIGMYQFFSEGEQGEANYLHSLRQVDRDELENVIRTFIRPDKLHAVILTPENAPGVDAVSLKQDVLAAWPGAATSTAQTATPPEASKTEVLDIGKGRKVILIPDNTLPYVSMDMVFQGGDALLSPDSQGLAELAARTLTKGTALYDATAMEEFQSNRASVISAGAGRQTFSVRARFPSRFNADMLTLFHDVILSPAFAAEEVQREITGQKAAIQSREDQPLGLAFRRMFPFLFQSEPYRFLHMGDAATLDTQTRETVTRFWQRQSGQPWVLSVCGSFDRESILRLAQSLPTPGEKPQTVGTPTWGTGHEQTLTLEDRNQAHLLMVFKTAPLGSEDAPALDLLQAILSGQSGLLFNDLRDKHGLGYTVTAFPWQTDRAGMLIFYIGTEPEKEQQALDGFRRVIGDLHTTLLPDTQLTRGKNLLRGDYYRDHQSLGSRSGEAAALAISGFPLDMNRTSIEKAEQLTADDLRTLSRKYLKPEEAYIIRVVP